MVGEGSSFSLPLAISRKAEVHNDLVRLRLLSNSQQVRSRSFNAGPTGPALLPALVAILVNCPSGKEAIPKIRIELGQTFYRMLEIYMLPLNALNNPESREQHATTAP
jgi:hypothetical protein